jgi:hypothetical protein
MAVIVNRRCGKYFGSPEQFLFLFYKVYTGMIFILKLVFLFLEKF